MKRSIQSLKRAVWQKEYGDTLIEVTISLGILSIVLISSTGLAIKASQMAQTAKERTIVANQAQMQMEQVRSFRDSHTWSQFLNGSPAGYFGLLNGASNTACHTTSPCLHMELSVIGSIQQSVPKPGGTTGTVPTSWIEISTIPDSTNPPKYLDIVVSYGFEGIGGGADNVGHLKTRLSNPALTPTPAPPPPPPCPNRGPNLVQNGTFALGAGNFSVVNSGLYGFRTGIPNRGPDVFPDDAGQVGATADLRGWGGGLSAWTHPGFVHGIETQVLPFPGDTSVNPAVPPASSFVYTNPGQAITEPKHSVGDNDPTFQGILWETTLNVEPNSKYDFSGYFANVLTQHYVTTYPDAVFPVIQISVDNTILQTPTQLPFNNSAWVPIHLMFTTGPGQTTAIFTIKDFAGNANGDDFAMTALGVNKCLP